MNSLHHLAQVVNGFSNVRILCVGDIMIDRYIYGHVDRVSAEAPIPILSYERERVMLGAVGNVARNVVSLGGQALITAIVGDDDAGRDAVRLVAQQSGLEADLVTVQGRRTSVKTRYIAQGQQLLRADREDTGPLDERSVSRLITAIQSEINETRILVLSDYAKGCLGDSVLRSAIDAAQKASVPIIVDPKSRNFSRYSGVTLLKPNIKELEDATGLPCGDDNSIETAGRKLLDDLDAQAILVTRSERGMTLVQKAQPVLHIRDRVSEVYDVSGAGDTAMAVLALALGSGAGFADAAMLANKACSLVVGKVGTATVSAGELTHALHAAEIDSAQLKIQTMDELAETVSQWRSAGARIGFANGCFDLIHAGHVSLLAQAKDTCDKLIVGLNTDASVRRIKSDDRPINNEMARAVVIASFGDVDTVVLFDEDTPVKLIEAIRPDVLIKGEDYTEEEVVGGEFVKSYGGDVFLAKLMPETSTSKTIGKIRS
ncbi:MAG: D-glycero-beta-D-manno-heptose-7-phosphate kinase [Alphaproteobacteria bacterium]|nr:MAG: D-glycero-beta-D-manno-heptose-7-phosphate kinase [Alphaproteobacteria bacterium]